MMESDGGPGQCPNTCISGLWDHWPRGCKSAIGDRDFTHPCFIHSGTSRVQYESIPGLQLSTAVRLGALNEALVEWCCRNANSSSWCPSHSIASVSLSLPGSGSWSLMECTHSSGTGTSTHGSWWGAGARRVCCWWTRALLLPVPGTMSDRSLFLFATLSAHCSASERSSFLTSSLHSPSLALQRWHQASLDLTHLWDDAAYVIRDPLYPQALPQLCTLVGKEEAELCCMQSQDKTIRYSVRSDDNFLKCPVLQPAACSDYGLQGEQGPAEPVLLAPEHSFPPELPFSINIQETSCPCSDGSNRRSGGCLLMGGGRCTQDSMILGFLCKYSLDKMVSLWELQPSLRGPQHKKWNRWQHWAGTPLLGRAWLRWSGRQTSTSQSDSERKLKIKDRKSSLLSLNSKNPSHCWGEVVLMPVNNTDLKFFYF